MNLTDNALTRAYEMLFTTYRLVGTRYRQTVVKDTIDDMIDEGVVYSFNASSSLANGATATFIGRVNGTPTHFYDLNVTVSAGAFTIEFFESPTVTSNGTAQTAINLNRQSTNTHNMNIFSSPTVTSNGTLLKSVKIFQTGTGGKGSGNAIVSDKWLLKPNTDYLVRITNNSGGVAEFVGSFSFYERTITGA